MIVIGLCIYSKYRTVHLKYNCETYAGQKIQYISVGDGIRLKDYPSVEDGVTIRGYQTKQIIINDKQVIKKIFDYLNSVPLRPAPERAGLQNVPKNRWNAIIEFYNEDNIIIGSIHFRGEEHLATSLHDKDVYMVRDKGTQIVLGLEALDL